MNVAYLVNQYPKLSHTFIRREIASLEEAGVNVARFSIRASSAADVLEADDQQELRRTRAVLSAGPAGLAAASVAVAASRPVRFAKALRLAIKTGWRSNRGIPRHVMYLAEACVLLQWTRQCRSEHVHAHFGTNSAAVAMLCRELGGPPYSVTVHGSEEFDKPRALSLGEKIRNAAFIVTISEFSRSQLYRWCEHAHWARIHIVRCGLDARLLRRRRTPVPAAPRLVCVGRLCEQKGHLLLLEAARRLAADGVRFQLVLVGDGPMRPEIERIIDENGLHNSVTITGQASSERVAQEIDASRAMVLPSFAEGLPVVIMEAFALGRPVISTFIGGIPELVEPGVCGWLVPAGSVDALASAMREALEAPVEQLQRMGDAGAERVARHHDVRVGASRLAELFASSIVAERGKTR